MELVGSQSVVCPASFLPSECFGHGLEHASVRHLLPRDRLELEVVLQLVLDVERTRARYPCSIIRISNNITYPVRNCPN